MEQAVGGGHERAKRRRRMRRRPGRQLLVLAPVLLVVCLVDFSSYGANYPHQATKGGLFFIYVESRNFT